MGKKTKILFFIFLFLISLIFSKQIYATNYFEIENRQLQNILFLDYEGNENQIHVYMDKDLLLKAIESNNEILIKKDNYLWGNILLETTSDIKKAFLEGDKQQLDILKKDEKDYILLHIPLLEYINGNYIPSYQNYNIEITTYGKNNEKINKYNFSFHIQEKIHINTFDINELEDSFYTGNEIKQKVLIKDGTEQLIDKIDYKIEYKNNKKVGTAQVNIIGIGKYKGTVTKNFKIKKAQLSKLSIGKIDNQVYTGKNIKPSVVIKNGSNKLKVNSDYTVKYKNNKQFGQATVTITGKGNYTGSVTKTFKIVPKKTTGLKATSRTTNTISITWNKVPSITAYRVYIYNEENKKYEYYGKATKNSITLKKLTYSKEYKIKVRAYKTVKGTNYFGEYSSILTTTTSPKKVTGIKTEARYTDKIEISWNKVSRASGYRVYIYDNSTKKYKYYGASNTNSITIKSLKQSTNYKIKIRAYKTVEGNKYFGEYSDVYTTVTSPKQVTNLKITSVDYTSLNIKWDKVSNAKAYRVYVWKASTGKYEYYGKANKNSTTIKTLNSNEQYKVRVRAYTELNGEKYFGKYSSEIKALVKPAKVTGLKTNKVYSDSVEIKWNNIENVTRYRVYIDKWCTGKYEYYGSTTANSIKINSLEEGTNYKIRVRAYRTINDEKYFGKYSSTITVSTGIEKLTISNKEYKNTQRLVYGESGQGKELVYYKIGKEDAKNVMILNFAIHGYEDAFAQDGYELVLVAHKLIKYLSDNIRIVKDNNWCIYIIPTSNPDGVAYKYGSAIGNCNGIGRKTYYILNKDGMLHEGGIDLNRCFPYNKAGGFKKYTDVRNYNGSEPMMAKEAIALNEFILDSAKRKVTGNKIFIDIHGWTNQIITTKGNQLYTALNKQFKYNYRTELNTERAYGYISHWALKNGYDSCLFEFPSDVSRRGDVAQKGYDTKFINAIKDILKNY